MTRKQELEDETNVKPQEATNTPQDVARTNVAVDKTLPMNSLECAQQFLHVCRLELISHIQSASVQQSQDNYLTSLDRRKRSPTG